MGRSWERKENPNSKELEGKSGGNAGVTGKKLSQLELQERSRKGLCFKCGEKWGRDHTCKMKHFRLLLVEGSEGETSEEEEGSEHGEAEELELAMKSLQVSLKSLKGLTSNKSFKVTGKVGESEVVVLVDTGASNSFISKVKAKELGLAVTNTPRYVVELGNGQRVSSRGICKGLVLQIQGNRIERTFFLLELGGADLILGMDWVESLNDIGASFRKMIIVWEENGGLQRITGDPALCKTESSWKATLKALKCEGEGYVIATAQAKGEVDTGAVITEETRHLLAEFEDLFQTPQALPPKREQDHAINLKE